MSRPELKHAIRAGLPTPNVDQDTFNAVLEETIREDHPDWKTMTLVESKQHSGHERMRAMLMEFTDRSTPVSDLKDAPRSGDSEFAPDFDAALAAASSSSRLVTSTMRRSKSCSFSQSPSVMLRSVQPRTQRILSANRQCFHAYPGSPQPLSLC